MLKYSLKDLAAEIEFDVEDFVPLINLFIETTELNLVDIGTSINKQDADVISSNIHNIKGASMNLGLESISKIMEQMSILNKKGSFADIEGVIAVCRAELTELRKVLENS